MTRNHLTMIRRLVPMLGSVLWVLWFIPASFGGTDNAKDLPSEDRPILKSTAEKDKQGPQRAEDTPLELDEAQDLPSDDKPILINSTMEKVILGAKRVEGAPKEFKDYVFESVIQAENEPWRETADEILINPGVLRWHRYLRALANTPEWLDIGLTHRMRVESLTNNFRKGAPETIEGIAIRTRLRVGADWKMFRVLVEGQNSTDIGESSNATSTLNASLLGTDRMLQAFLAMKLENVFGTGLRTDLHVGRMTMDFGERRFIARNEFRNTTNTFQGVHWNLAEEKVWRTRAFIVSPVAETFGVLQPVEDTVFWGVQYEDRRKPWLFFDAYYFGINGGGQTLDQQRAFGTYGLRYFRSAEVNRLDYEGESAFQKGTRSGLPHFAYFQHAQVGYTFNLPFQPHLIALYDYASGTSNPTSGKSGAFDTLFGARRAELNPSGIFGPFFRSNIISPGVRLEMQTSRNTDVMLKWRAWWLAQSKDAWVGSGLQDPTGAAGNYLGHDVEIRARWNWNTFLALDAGFSHFFKGSYISYLAQTPGNPSARDSDYTYIQAELRF